jgi:transcriptional regulator with XRE-family HTH domain
MMTIGQNISINRKEKGITQEQLAEICNVSPQAVSKWENDISYPDITLLKTIARTFGISVDKLLDDGSMPAVILSENESVKGKLLKIRIVDHDDKINLNLPIPLIELLLKDGNISDKIMLNGKASSIKTVDFQQIMEMVSLGVLGKILEMESEDGTLMEIFVE